MSHDLRSLAGLDRAALAAAFAEGTPPSAEWLKERVAGALLASGAPGPLDRLAAPALRAYGGLGAFEGKSFAPDGTRGANRMLGEERLPFSCAVADSVLDRRPALRLSYDRPENLAPVRALFDELRRIDERTAIGPSFVRLPFGPPRLVFWFGIEIV